MEKIVEMNDIHKQFPFVKAVDGARFDLYRGEIHSLIGENGAGKSTMMKILYGMYSIDQGEIIVNGKRVSDSKYTTHDAIALGIGMVHQEFMLVKEMTRYLRISSSALTHQEGQQEPGNRILRPPGAD